MFKDFKGIPDTYLMLAVGLVYGCFFSPFAYQLFKVDSLEPEAILNFAGTLIAVSIATIAVLYQVNKTRVMHIEKLDADDTRDRKKFIRNHLPQLSEIEASLLDFSHKMGSQELNELDYNFLFSEKMNFLNGINKELYQSMIGLGFKLINLIDEDSKNKRMQQTYDDAASTLFRVTQVIHHMTIHYEIPLQYLRNED